MMKKQFFRVKQLADQTIFKADKSEVLNSTELQNADQKFEFLRQSLSAILKKIPPGQNNDEKRAKKSLEYHLASVFKEQYEKSGDAAGFADGRQCRLFIEMLKECEQIESCLAKHYQEHEQKIEEFVSCRIHNALETEFPTILKHKRNLTKYILDKDSANNRYNNATKKEALKEDKDEAENKVEQTRDVFAYEMFSVLAKENDFASYLLQILKCQRGYHEEALRTLADIIPMLEQKIGDSDVRCVYRVPLEDHLRVTKSRIAFPLQVCITFLLSEERLKEEGLFRIAGSSSRVKRFRASLDSGCFTWEQIPDYLDNHVVASALKMYLRELPDPLLTSYLYKEWMQSMQPQEHQKRVENVKNLINKLPQANRDNLNYLIKFLAKLSNCTLNKMNASNIAIVISPNLLWDNNEETLNMGNCSALNMLVELLIKEVDVLFPDDVTVAFTFKETVTHHQQQQQSENSTAISKQCNDVSASVESLVASDSPKVQKKRKPAAPVPPIARTDQDVNNTEKSMASSLSQSYPSGSSTLNRPPKTKENVVKASIGISTDEKFFDNNKARVNNNVAEEKLSKDTSPSALHSQPSSSPPPPPAPSTLVNLPNSQTVEHKIVPQPPIQLSKAKPIQPVVAQTQCDNKNFSTTITHQIHSYENKSPKPIAAPRSIDINRRPVSRNSSIKLIEENHSSSNENKSTSTNPAANNSDDVVLRKPNIPSKPEILPRPATIAVQKRSSVDLVVDPTVQKTQCSVYSTASKQQPSYVNVQNRNEKYQPGHDNQIAEKEKFLGHPPSSHRLSLENKYADINSNNKPGIPPKLMRSNDRLDSTKSNEDLAELSDNNKKMNGNQKPSHVRTKSDGNLFEKCGIQDQQQQHHQDNKPPTPSSPRSLTKPSHAPPPPPVGAVVKKDWDSTDL